MPTSDKLKDSIREIEKLYAIKDKRKTLKYLQDRKYLYPVLLEAPERVREYFGRTLKGVGLEYYYDGIDDYEALHITISTTLDGDKFIEREEKMLMEWFFTYTPEQVKDLHFEAVYV